MHKTTLAALIVLITSSAYSEDVFVLGFSTLTRLNECRTVYWRGDTHFFNPTDVPLEVNLIDISNGGIPPGYVLPKTFQLQPRSWASVPWGGPLPLWVLHLDVPPEVLVENREDALGAFVCTSSDLIDSRVHVALPVIRALTQPGTPQVKLGTDVGMRPAHQNVIVYNDGTERARAHIEIRRSCDNTLATERTVTIEPKTVIQVNGLPTGNDSCNSRIPGYARYTVVTVDQPSFSVVSTIAEPLAAGIDHTAPRVELAVH